MMFIFITHDSINLTAQCAKGWGVGGGEIKSHKKEHTWRKVIHGKGGFSDVCGTQPKSLIPLLFVVGSFRAWEQSWKRLRKPNNIFKKSSFLQHLESVGVFAMMSKGVVQEHIEE